VGYRMQVHCETGCAGTSCGAGGGPGQRVVAREFGLARKTVRKMLEYSALPGYQRQKPVRRPELDPCQGHRAFDLSPWQVSDEKIDSCGRGS